MAIDILKLPSKWDLSRGEERQGKSPDAVDSKEDVSIDLLKNSGTVVGAGDALLAEM